jgi:hypothetical protein
MVLSFDGAGCSAVWTIEGSDAPIDYFGGHVARYDTAGRSLIYVSGKREDSSKDMPRIAVRQSGAAEACRVRA